MGHDAHEVLAALREGNRRFSAAGSFGHFDAEHRARAIGPQEPSAVVVACSDSRVPVEAVFDAEAGELFVVRTAGHVLAEASLASVRFAVEKLGASVVIVLGHEDCGAVAAALSHDAPAWLAPITSHIRFEPLDADALAAGGDRLLASAVDEHVRHTVADLREAVAAYDLPVGRPVTVVGAAYELTSGLVHWLD